MCVILPAMPRSFVLSWILVGVVPAQTPDPAQLAADLQKAHRGKTAGRPVDRFSARLQLTQRGRDEDRITVRLDVRFWHRPDRDLIRYELKEGGRVVQRGWDRKGPWVRIDDRIEDLRSREFRRDLDSLRRELRLARQILRFLDPAGLVSSLENARVRAEELRVGRMAPIPCYVVSGRLERFPFYGAAGSAQPAFLELWIDRESKRLRAAHARRLDERGKRLPEGEFVTMHEHRSVRGVLLPTLITIDRLRGERREPLVRVEIMAFDVFPEFEEKDLSRDAE